MSIFISFAVLIRVYFECPVRFQHEKLAFTIVQCVSDTTRNTMPRRPGRGKGPGFVVAYTWNPRTYLFDDFWVVLSECF